MRTFYFLCLSVLIGFTSSNSSFAQNDTPCECTNRWEGGGTWNDDGSIDDSPNSDEPNGIIRCGSSAETQSQVPVFNNCVYDPASFEIDVSGGGCVDPSDGSIIDVMNPTPGEPIIWLNFDVRAFAGFFEIQINDNSGDNIGWALFTSETHTAGTDFVPSAGDELSGDCSNLQMMHVSCGAESSNTWNQIPIEGEDFFEPANFYIAIWDQDADGDVRLNNFKARFGCGDGDPLCIVTHLEPEVKCSEDETFTVEIPIRGVNAQYTAQDPNANSISGDICLGNLIDGDTAGSITLVYDVGVDPEIVIKAVSPPTMQGCADPENAATCTDTIRLLSPEVPVCDAQNDGPIACLKSTVNLDGTGTGNNLKFEWSGPNGFSSDQEDASTTVPGEYIFTVTDSVTMCSSVCVTTVAIDTLPPDCDDNDCNTTDSYDRENCECVNAPIPPPNCDDNDCNTADSYNAETCECEYEPITPPNCDDNDCNTADSYNAETCECEYEPITPPNCDDNDCNTADSYNAETCECEYEPITPPNCDDDDCNTADSYNAETCECEYEPITPPNCDDNDCNTADSYNAETCECEYEPITPPNCDDNDCNTADSYNAETCECEYEPITPPNCDDNDCNTADSYNAETCECEYEPITPPNCDDNDCNTADSYNAETCECEYEPITPPNCDDNDCNTADSYNAETCECEYEPITPPNCDDNDCNTADSYNAETCECEYEPITPSNCDDNDCNTADSYNAETCECEYEPITPPNCDDNDCNTADSYNAETCECEV